MVGISGSGKSTYAQSLCQSSRLCVVSTDSIRARINGNEADQRNPKEVFEQAYKETVQALAAGKDVVFDATNTTRKGREKLLQRIPRTVRKVCVLFPVDLETAKIQNKMRQRVVPDEVIDRQHAQLLRDGESILTQFNDIIFYRR